jgi:hypothetical protein
MMGLFDASNLFGDLYNSRVIFYLIRYVPIKCFARNSLVDKTAKAEGRGRRKASGLWVGDPKIVPLIFSKKRIFKN